MIGYIVRRLLYGALILVGVNLVTFVLFFAVNTPDDMARLSIGGQRVSADAIEKWKVERGYDKPLFLNASREGLSKYTDTIFYQRSLPLLTFDFGASDGGRDIGREIQARMGPSLALAVPTFAIDLPEGGGKVALQPDYRCGDGFLSINGGKAVKYPGPLPEQPGQTCSE